MLRSRRKISKQDAAIGDQIADVEKVDASTSISKGHYNLVSTCGQIEVKPQSKKRPHPPAPFEDTNNHEIKKSKLDVSSNSHILGGKENYNPNCMSFGDSNYKDLPPSSGEDISSFGISYAEFSVPNKTFDSARKNAADHSNFANYSNPSHLAKESFKSFGAQSIISALPPKAKEEPEVP